MRVVIFGGGYLGRILACFFDDIIGFVDNNEKLWGTKILSKYNVFSPNELGTMAFDAIVISTFRYRDEIRKQIIALGFEDKIIEIKFDDDKISWYEFSDLEQIEHSYSITIHKAQGSEFDVVIMVIPRTAPILLTRNLLYTGITRAKELLVVIGAKQTIDFMIQNVDSKKRNTGLEFKLKNK